MGDQERSEDKVRHYTNLYVDGEWARPLAGDVVDVTFSSWHPAATVAITPAIARRYGLRDMLERHSPVDRTAPP
jgi:hypothetical protein